MPRKPSVKRLPKVFAPWACSHGAYRIRHKLAWLSWGFALGCSASAHKHSSATGFLPQPPAPWEQAAPGVPTNSALAASLKDLLCEERSPCQVVEDKSAGLDAAKRTLRVIKLSLKRDGTESDEGPVCEPFEYWLTVSDKESIVQTQLLASICNDGYGASSVGEDEITITNNRFEHNRYGGSAWRWTMDKTLQLSPLQVLSESSTGFWGLGPNRSESEWSWERFSGKTSWYAPACDPQGMPPQEEGPPENPFASILLPQIGLEASYVNADWKTTSLGQCAALVDATGQHGFSLYGKPGLATDALMQVVANDSNLFIEIRDDRWVGPSARWVNDDHLEIWLSPSHGDFSEPCLDKTAEKPVQWAIRIVDGKVFPAFGRPNPAALRIERSGAVVQGSPIRFKIGLPSGYQGVTILYSDGDDGKRQKHLLATSRLRRGIRETLGTLYPIDKNEAICVINKGQLEPKIAHEWHSTQAIIE